MHNQASRGNIDLQGEKKKNVIRLTGLIIPHFFRTDYRVSSDEFQRLSYWHIHSH